MPNKFRGKLLICLSLILLDLVSRWFLFFHKNAIKKFISSMILWILKNILENNVNLFWYLYSTSTGFFFIPSSTTSFKFERNPILWTPLVFQKRHGVFSEYWRNQSRHESVSFGIFFGNVTLALHGMQFWLWMFSQTAKELHGYHCFTLLWTCASIYQHLTYWRSHLH